MTQKGAPLTKAAREGQIRRRREERAALTFADLEDMSIPAPNSGCLLWLGAVNTKGYGRTPAGNSAHRVAYEKRYGPIPKGFEPDHLCRVRCCIEPTHLEAVTHLENLRRGEGILSRVGDLNRAKTVCPQGHPYSGENLFVRARGARECRICMRGRSQNARRRRAK